MRFPIALIGGLVSAFALFLLMNALIAGRGGVGDSVETGQLVDFVRIKPDDLVQQKQRRVPKKPPPPKKRPPPPKMTVSKTDKPPPQNLNIVTPNISVPVSTGSGPYIGGFSAGQAAAEGDVIPIVRIEPQFPREALINGIEGWVKVRFTINPDGSVANPTVVESEPRRLFNRNAIRAILRWKFKPRIVDGVAVAREAEQVIEFKLDQT